MADIGTAIASIIKGAATLTYKILDFLFGVVADAISLPLTGFILITFFYASDVKDAWKDEDGWNRRFTIFGLTCMNVFRVISEVILFVFLLIASLSLLRVRKVWSLYLNRSKNDDELGEIPKYAIYSLLDILSYPSVIVSLTWRRSSWLDLVWKKEDEWWLPSYGLLCVLFVDIIGHIPFVFCFFTWRNKDVRAFRNKEDALGLENVFDTYGEFFALFIQTFVDLFIFLVPTPIALIGFWRWGETFSILKSDERGILSDQGQEDIIDVAGNVIVDLVFFLFFCPIVLLTWRHRRGKEIIKDGSILKGEGREKMLLEFVNIPVDIFFVGFILPWNLLPWRFSRTWHKLTQESVIYTQEGRIWITLGVVLVWVELIYFVLFVPLAFFLWRRYEVMAVYDQGGNEKDEKNEGNKKTIWSAELALQVIQSCLNLLLDLVIFIIPYPIAHVPWRFKKTREYLNSVEHGILSNGGRGYVINMTMEVSVDLIIFTVPTLISLLSWRHSEARTVLKEKDILENEGRSSMIKIFLLLFLDIFYRIIDAIALTPTIVLYVSFRREESMKIRKEAENPVERMFKLYVLFFTKWILDLLLIPACCLFLLIPWRIRWTIKQVKEAEGFDVILRPFENLLNGIIIDYPTICISLVACLTFTRLPSVFRVYRDAFAGKYPNDKWQDSLWGLFFYAILDLPCLVLPLLIAIAYPVRLGYLKRTWHEEYLILEERQKNLEPWQEDEDVMYPGSEKTPYRTSYESLIIALWKTMGQLVLFTVLRIMDAIALACACFSMVLPWRFIALVVSLCRSTDSGLRSGLENALLYDWYTQRHTLKKIEEFEESLSESVMNRQRYHTKNLIATWKDDIKKRLDKSIRKSFDSIESMARNLMYLKTQLRQKDYDIRTKHEHEKKSKEKEEAEDIEKQDGHSLTENDEEGKHRQVSIEMKALGDEEDLTSKPFYDASSDHDQEDKYLLALIEARRSISGQYDKLMEEVESCAHFHEGEDKFVHQRPAVYLASRYAKLRHANYAYWDLVLKAGFLEKNTLPTATLSTLQDEKQETYLNEEEQDAYREPWSIPFWDGFKGLKEWNEDKARLLCYYFAQQTLYDLIAIVGFFITLIGVVRVKPLYKRTKYCLGMKGFRDSVLDEVLEGMVDRRYFLMALLTVVMLVRAFPLINDLIRDFRTTKQPEIFRHTISKHFWGSFKDIWSAFSFLLNLEMVWHVFTASLYAVTLPGFVVYYALDILPFCCSSKTVKGYLAAIITAFLFVFPIALVSRGIPDEKNPQDQQDLATSGLFVFFFAHAFIILGTLLGFASHDSFSTLHPATKQENIDASINPGLRIRSTNANLIAGVSIIVDILQLAGVVFLIDGVPFSKDILKGGLSFIRGIYLKGFDPPDDFSDATGSFNRRFLSSNDDSILTQEVAGENVFLFYMKFILLLVWVYVVGIPIVAEQIKCCGKKWRQEGEWSGTPAARIVRTLFSTTLFLTIIQTGFNVLSCNYPEAAGEKASLVSDPSMTCWEGSHTVLAVLAITGLTFYLPTSLLFATMEMEASVKDLDIRHTELFTLALNLTKASFVAVAVFGSGSPASGAVITVIALLFVLFMVFYKWRFKSNFCSIWEVGALQTGSFLFVAWSGICAVVAFNIDDRSDPTSGNLYLGGGVMIASLTVLYIIFFRLYQRWKVVQGDDPACTSRIVKTLVRLDQLLPPCMFYDEFSDKSPYLVGVKATKEREKWRSSLYTAENYLDAAKAILTFFKGIKAFAFHPSCFLYGPKIWSNSPFYYEYQSNENESIDDIVPSLIDWWSLKVRSVKDGVELEQVFQELCLSLSPELLLFLPESEERSELASLMNFEHDVDTLRTMLLKRSSTSHDIEEGTSEEEKEEKEEKEERPLLDLRLNAHAKKKPIRSSFQLNELLLFSTNKDDASKTTYLQDPSPDTVVWTLHGFEPLELKETEELNKAFIAFEYSKIWVPLCGLNPLKGGDADESAILHGDKTSFSRDLNVWLKLADRRLYHLEDVSFYLFYPSLTKAISFGRFSSGTFYPGYTDDILFLNKQTLDNCYRNENLSSSSPSPILETTSRDTNEMDSNAYTSNNMRQDGEMTLEEVRALADQLDRDSRRRLEEIAKQDELMLQGQEEGKKREEEGQEEGQEEDQEEPGTSSEIVSHSFALLDLSGQESEITSPSSDEEKEEEEEKKKKSKSKKKKKKKEKSIVINTESDGALLTLNELSD